MSSLTLPSSMYHKTLQTEVHLLSVAEKQEEIRRLRVIMQEITCLEAMAAPSSALLEELLEVSKFSHVVVDDVCVSGACM